MSMITPEAEPPTVRDFPKPPPPCADGPSWGRVEDYSFISEPTRGPNRVRACHIGTFLQKGADVVHAAEEVGPERLGFMTIMDGRGRGDHAVSQAFCDATREIKKKTSFEWVRVLDHTEKGQAHIHAITVLPCDIATGFDWPAYKEMQRLSRRRDLSPEDRQRRSDLGKRVTKNLELKRLWKLLRKIFVRYGFTSRIELTPVRNPIAAAKYLGKRYCGEIRAALPGGSKVQRFTSTVGFPKAPKVVKDSDYQQKRDLILEAAGLKLADMRRCYGSGWNWSVIMVIRRLKFLFGPKPSSWPAEKMAAFAGEYFPPRPFWFFSPPIERRDPLAHLAWARARQALEKATRNQDSNNEIH